MKRTLGLFGVIGLVILTALQASGDKGETDTSVIVVNPIEVPEGKESLALAIWDRYAAFFRGQPGYLGTTLHESLDPNAKFHLVNVARWESAEAFLTALQSEELKQLGEGFPEDMPHYPSMYQIVRTE